MSKTLSEGVRWGAPSKKDAHSKLMSGNGNPMAGVSRVGTPAIEKAKITKMLCQEKWKHLVTPKHHRTALLLPLKILASIGEVTEPRGMKTIEVENFRYELPPYVRFMNFDDRKLNLPYIKKEFLWYLRGNRTDLSILDHAKMWQSLVQADGGINSNYGQYFFAPSCNQFQRVIDVLSSDKDSRRAAMVILQPAHTLTHTSDQPCTYALRFSIRNNKLNMTVHMRSQDAIFGAGNDAPCFSFIHEMAFVKLNEIYHDLQYGIYTHLADSFHAYERHFGMLKSMTGIDVNKPLGGNGRRAIEKSPTTKYGAILCPQISSAAEVDFLLCGDFTNIPSTFSFTQWMLA